MLVKCGNFLDNFWVFNLKVAAKFVIFLKHASSLLLLVKPLPALSLALVAASGGPASGQAATTPHSLTYPYIANCKPEIELDEILPRKNFWLALNWL